MMTDYLSSNQTEFLKLGAKVVLPNDIPGPKEGYIKAFLSDGRAIVERPGSLVWGIEVGKLIVIGEWTS